MGQLSFITATTNFFLHQILSVQDLDVYWRHVAQGRPFSRRHNHLNFTSRHTQAMEELLTLCTLYLRCRDLLEAEVYRSKGAFVSFPWKRTSMDREVEQ